MLLLKDSNMMKRVLQSLDNINVWKYSCGEALAVVEDKVWRVTLWNVCWLGVFPSAGYCCSMVHTVQKTMILVCTFHSQNALLSLRCWFNHILIICVFCDFIFFGQNCFYPVKTEIKYSLMSPCHNLKLKTTVLGIFILLQIRPRFWNSKHICGQTGNKVIGFSCIHLASWTSSHSRFVLHYQTAKFWVWKPTEPVGRLGV